MAKNKMIINRILKFNANEGSMGLYVLRLLVSLRKTKTIFSELLNPLNSRCSDNKGLLTQYNKNCLSLSRAYSNSLFHIQHHTAFQHALNKYDQVCYSLF